MQRRRTTKAQHKWREASISRGCRNFNNGTVCGETTKWLQTVQSNGNSSVKQPVWSLPRWSVPGCSLPGWGLPGCSLPGRGLPGQSLLTVLSLPGGSLPGWSVPEWSIYLDEVGEHDADHQQLVNNLQQVWARQHAVLQTTAEEVCVVHQDVVQVWHLDINHTHCNSSIKHWSWPLTVYCPPYRWVRRFLMAQHISTIRLYSAILVGSRWKIQDRRQI